ncbi:MAG: sigma-70 family RNA polymerase sigma factor [Candidatus Omnitrophica bacterium]|nr:sigma-70 family RNA polymerase sigma factor [Candidatus Omnitrophota bacterium]
MEFEKLAKKLTPKLKAIAYKLNRRFTFFNEDDLFQEALVHLWKESAAGKLADKTDSYILQGCYFHLQNYIRTAKDKFASFSLDAHYADDNEHYEEPLELKDERSGDYFERLNREMIVDVIRNNGLTPREKELLPFLGEGLTIREIGRKVGVSHVRVLKMKEEIRRKCLKHLDKI